ncbi:hypothetical protein [Roseibacillus persicicus]|uniref:hypothetical protein n=1 Tax=Roseibacillus persicicus TaxID=454148 RepID=UPI0016764108|nr:hypothetical protein [Roseibacillus persicicus]
MKNETLKRYHCYLRAAGINCRQERDELIASAMRSGKDVLASLHDLLVANCKAARYPVPAASGSSCMKPAPFRFVWERQRSRMAKLRVSRRRRSAENLFTGAKLWVLSAVRAR